MAAIDLFRSAWTNDVAGVRAALLAGVDPNEPHPRSGTLPLQLACDNDAIEAIDLLLAAGARADVVFSPVSRVSGGVFSNRTPLMYVRSIEAARRLLDAGARLDVADARGWTALVWAAFGADLALTRFLVDQGAATSVRPWFAGANRSLTDFLQTVAEPPPGAAETEAGKERRSQLEAVRAFIASRMDDEGPA
jgi:ankyrin repeat protein